MKNNWIKYGCYCLFILLLSNCSVSNKNVLFTNGTYSVYSDSVVQGDFTSVALSDSELISNYKSPHLKSPSPEIAFKFSINGDDNENISGKDHRIICLSKNCSTPVIPFGAAWVDTTHLPAGSYLQTGTQLTFKVDTRAVLKSFKQKGYYTTFNGKKVYKDEFKGVFIAGNVAPLTWDFANLATHKDLQMKDEDKDGIYELTLTLHPVIDTTASHWKLTGNLTSLPKYHSDHTVVNTLYNLSLEELQQDIRPDSTFMAGKKWDGVWTRDISYSTILSLALLYPEICRNSLLYKVKDSIIIQDTGTGGSYPISTDRMVWSIAAWEVYKVTGDRAWLKRVYKIIKKSAAADEENIYDPVTGLVSGESSFMDWREQSYPKWMQPVDIFNSFCLGTNAVHYETNNILARMSKILGDEVAFKKYSDLADKIKHAVNKYLWMPDKGYYGEYLYGNIFKVVSPKSETLGESLCVLFDIASEAQQKSILENVPVLQFGVPCFYPQIPNIPPYHNDAIWPFVDAYWTLAAAKAGDEKAAMFGMNSIYRAAALFLTNKENFVAGDGDYIGTQINSDRQLWSVAGNLAMIYKVIFGMHFQPDSLLFSPFVPYSYRGEQHLNGFHYRNAVFNITITGYGNKIRSFKLDGQNLNRPIISGSLKGRHTIEIILSNSQVSGRLNLVPNHFASETPKVNLSHDTLYWKPVAGVKAYRVVINGGKAAATKDTLYVVTPDHYAEYQVIAIDSGGFQSFASEPVVLTDSAMQQIEETEQFAPASELPYKGFSGKGFVEISTTKNRKINFEIHASEEGNYIIDFRYSNGNGPINTDNKCAMRSLFINGQRKGTLVFPQRGQGQWSNWGFSNKIIVQLHKGFNSASLILEPFNTNMNGKVNQAMLDYARVIRLK